MGKNKGKKRNAAKKKSGNVDQPGAIDPSTHALVQSSSTTDFPEDDQLSSEACALHFAEREAIEEKKGNVDQPEFPNPCVATVEQSSNPIDVSGSNQLSNEACALPITGIHHEEITKETNPLKTLNLELEPKLPLVLDLPRKPKELGRMGRLIKLISNCFPLEFCGENVYHYDIEINRMGSNYTTEDSSGATQIRENENKKYRCLYTKLNREVFRIMQRDHAGFGSSVFDGKKNIYSIQPLAIRKEGYEILLDSEIPGDSNDPRGPRKDIFKVKIKPVKREAGDNIISLEPLRAVFKGKVVSVPQEAVMVLETVLRHTPCLRYVPVGRSFYYPPYPNESYPLAGGKEIWFGYHQSVLLGQKQTMINLDISSTAFYENISVIDYVAKFLNKSVRDLHHIGYLGQKDIMNLSRDLNNVKVEVTHLHYPRKYIVRGVSEDSANNIKFPIEKNSKTRVTTIYKYFLQQHNVRLKFPHLPCLSVKAGKDVFLPFEVCTIVENQHYKKELNGRQLSEMITFTAIQPKDRFLETLEIYKNSNYDKDPFLKVFDIKVLRDPIKVTGRVMEAPQVQYSNEIVRPKNGSWNMKNIKFYCGTEIHAWTLLSFADPDDCPEELLQKFAKSLCKYAYIQGIKLDSCKHIEIADAELQNVNISLRKMKAQYNAGLIFIVLPLERQRHASSQNRQEEIHSNILYSEIKKVAETNIGLITQCVKCKNVQERCNNPSFISNLCLKLNAKMGGINNILMPGEISEFVKHSILIIGADVNHSANEDSIAAVVGSMDEYYYRYAASVSYQKHEKNQKKTCEVILDMKNMIHKILLEFQKVRKHRPQKIIVYRDGVSEGQFQDVQNREIKCIKDACSSISHDYKPGITFIVVQKKHHRKFIPENQMQGVRPTGNVPPGTTVDSVVTHPLNFDFYLYSHLGIKGTSNCPYYTVLHDDNKYGFDALEKLSYYLCHIYVRCTKSISVPCPIQYADLAAYRARKYLNSYLKDLGDKGLLKEKDNRSKLANVPIEEIIRAITIKDNLKDTMYFT